MLRCVTRQKPRVSMEITDVTPRSLKGHGHWEKVPSDWKKPPAHFQAQGEETLKNYSSVSITCAQKDYGANSPGKHIQAAEEQKCDLEPARICQVQVTFYQPIFCDNRLQITLESPDSARLLTGSHSIFKT